MVQALLDGKQRVWNGTRNCSDQGVIGTWMAVGKFIWRQMLHMPIKCERTDVSCLKDSLLLIGILWLIVQFELCQVFF